MTNPNDSVFPDKTTINDGLVIAQSYGLTKLEYFAGLAMQGLLAGDYYLTSEELAQESIAHAKALITELNKEQ